MSTDRSNRIRWGIAAGAIALVLGGAALYPATTWAAGLAQQQTPSSPADPRTSHESALAAALGITVEELQAAQTKAAGAALDQAVADGQLTQAQADQIKARVDGGMLFGGHGGRGGHFGGRGIEGSTIHFDALLADALGITVDELNAARETVFTDLLSQAVTDGKITQEQADLAQARHDLAAYVQPRVAEARQQALIDAVAAGIVTQEQLDVIQKQGQGLMGEMHGFPGMMGGPDDFDGHGGGHGGTHGGGHGGWNGQQGDDSAQPDQQNAPDFPTPDQPTQDQSQGNG